MSNNELQHWGTKGMKWGIRRYQNKDGSLTPLGKKRYGIMDAEELKKKEAESAEAIKNKAMTSGNVKDIAANRHNMTNDEYRKALDRIDLERRLDSYSKEEKKSFMDKAEAVVNKIDKVRNMGEKLVNSYNLIAKINNSLSDKQMPTLDGNRKDKVDEFKEKLIKSGSADEIVKNFGNFTTAELNDINNRLQRESEIRSKTSEAQAKKQQDKAKKQQDEAQAKKQQDEPQPKSQQDEPKKQQAAAEEELKKKKENK